MRDKAKLSHTPIIKRPAARGRTGSHGGAWKVAFADFTLAMMALFMVLWIMEATTKQEREYVVQTINKSTIFAGIGGYEPIHPTLRQTVDQRNEAIKQTTSTTASVDEVENHSKAEMKDLYNAIIKISSDKHAQSNLQIEIVPQGLRIQIGDDKHNEMFSRSSSKLKPFFKNFLHDIAPVLNQLDNKIVIIGHTDATKFRDQALYNNWKLSGDRAVAAQQSLLANGLKENKILQVNAMADQVLLNSKHPYAAENRRIEIMVLTKTAADRLYQFFSKNPIKVEQPKDI